MRFQILIVRGGLKVLLAVIIGPSQFSARRVCINFTRNVHTRLNQVKGWFSLIRLNGTIFRVIEKFL